LGSFGYLFSGAFGSITIDCGVDRVFFTDFVWILDVNIGYLFIGNIIKVFFILIQSSLDGFLKLLTILTLENLRCWFR